ncbi:hypothetical protein TGPRC2_240470 [Toxoplasma gondii TgCatPRC2]|uniref:Uncharacterized protein n=14 Tax=Toxoplasma gondii TaxID=5811 RepID=A0A125YFH5_TOXGV|nr:hypothetical protein TGME49_240470 [Toxoplasma gondii ME49]EPR60548.1 hypothetical protein TGGT1_240470 [Toxoplasma gondii GT1]ESS31450.1 hypothetical protein TGVEG_240470 [Toxoplasma gondii VEG]KAF4643402.1 hypothetical protein TGRH88_030680 [Toxoplasma gondii]KFG38805.1 hypothetical protein TGP89_240470 [Toxoplasma gondii p89]KFG39402.1 hypothetical protein TGDOM2_240470 [Toxoplasma gondii GAB2-2007-GAL-DOM2]KFG48657.1 hypothetical protein TGFOU_240470 [Toxoplasma gondii FOU]KFG59758.1 |eukprot:XP_018637619.1 hypothetical protein TGME49_240470 [Toxoplasma gondii ME49]
MTAMDWDNESLGEKLFVPGRKAASALFTGRYFTLDRTSFVTSRSKPAVYRSNISAPFLQEHHLQGERFFKHCLLTLILIASPVLWSRAQLVTEVYETCTAVEGEIARCGPGANCFIIGGVPTCHCILDVATGLPLAGNPYKACTWDISGNWQLFSHYTDKKDVEKEKKPKAGSMRQVLSPLSNEPFIVRLDRTDALLRTRLAFPAECSLMRETTSQSFSNKLKALLITSDYWTRRISKEAGKKTMEPWLRSMLHRRRGTGQRLPTFVQLGWYGALRFGSNRIDIYSPATGEPIYSLLRVDTLPSFTPSGAPAMQELFKPTTKEVVMMPSSTQFQISVDPPKMPLNLIVADAEGGRNDSGGEMAFTKRQNALDNREAFAEALFREEMRGGAEELMAAASDILAGLTRFTT